MALFLDDTKYQNALKSIFDEYTTDLEEVLDGAIVESHGKMPENLSNDIYLLFRSINKSLEKCERVSDAIKELEIAKNAYLRRAIIDSYQIIINGILKEVDPLIENLKELELDSDFRACISNVTEKMHRLRCQQREVKLLYRNAKREERKGNYSKAVTLYNETLDSAYKVEPLLEEFLSDRSYMVAIKKFDQKKKEEKRQHRFTMITIIVSCVLTAILTCIVEFVIKP